ncbi:DUF4097 family beta strand repeat-containing protein [Ezakiella coagulans]|uniref:DUF4097 family beta strand repeat-containing protein n=1 Tax=Ezakiella coagulans TaxID=46507 RepID=UPI00288B7EEC|nr:DUF4097 family beta strand repeat-containing protein [Ezakiella coagulans]
MNEEKKMILKMLEQGKITVEQAEKLLDAVNENSSENSEEPKKNTEYKIPEDDSKMNGFFSGIGDFVKKTVQTAIETATGSTSFLGDFKAKERGKSDMVKSFRKDLDENIEEIKLDLGESQIVVKETDEDAPFIKVWVDKEFTEEEFNSEFEVLYRSDDSVCVSQIKRSKSVSINIIGGKSEKGYNYSSITELYIPSSNNISLLDLNTETGGISISDIDIGDLKAVTDFGGVRLNSIDVDDLSVAADAGSIDASNINCDDLTLTADFGSIKLDNINADLVRLTSDAGNILASNVNCDDIKLATDAGNLKIFNSDVDSCTMRSSAGSLSANRLSADELKMQTSAGSIAIEDLVNTIDTIDAKTDAGNIKAGLSNLDNEITVKMRSSAGTLNYPDEFKLINSSAGNREIYRDGNSPLDVILSTNFGNVKVY